MKINIKTTNIILTDYDRDYLLRKIGKLNNYIKSINIPREMRVEIGRTSARHKKGKDIFRAEVNLKLGSVMLRGEAVAADIKIAIGKVRDNLEREIKHFKERQSARYKKGARKAKEILRT